MSRQSLWAIGGLLALAVASGCTPTPPAPTAPAGSLGVIPPQPDAPVELWRGEPRTSVYAPPGEPGLLVVSPMTIDDPRWVAVVDWRANRELWRADSANCRGMAAVGGRLACATDAGIDWYDLRRGGTPASTPLPHAFQVTPLSDGTALAFSTSDLSPPDPGNPKGADTFGVLDAEGIRWQHPITDQSDNVSLSSVGVEGEVVFLMRVENWEISVAAAATTAGEPVSMPDKAAAPVRIAGTDRLAYATTTPSTTHFTDLAGHEVASASGGPTWSSRYDGVFVRMADDGSVRGRPVRRSADTLALLDPDGKPLSTTPIKGVLPAALCGGVVYTITSEGTPTPGETTQTDPTYGLRAHDPDGTVLWDEPAAWPVPIGAFCDGTRLVLHTTPEGEDSLLAFTRQGPAWTLPRPTQGQGLGPVTGVEGVGILIGGGDAPRLLGQKSQP